MGINCGRIESSTNNATVTGSNRCGGICGSNSGSSAEVVECCNYGKVIDKYTMPRGNSRDYYIVANVNSNDIKIKSKSYG